ncbi:hypothetical protein O3P69_002550 [Scylla paramamosain]|uniref:Uncharacterized protein n=1 Tax=Scylla paramamosain TaxID=85552 RepID=A0AAW0URL5_SCYPA
MEEGKDQYSSLLAILLLLPLLLLHHLPRPPPSYPHRKAASDPLPLTTASRRWPVFPLQANQDFQGVNLKFPGAQTPQQPPTKPKKNPNVLSLPPQKDTFLQHSHLQQVSLPAIQPTSTFPYSFVRPGSATHTNHINAPPPPHQALHVNAQGTQVSPPPTPLRLPTRPHLKPSKPLQPLPPRQIAAQPPGRPQQHPKTSRPKKPSLWGSPASFTTSQLQQDPQKRHPQQGQPPHHNRPRPQPQRVFIPPQKIIHKKEITSGNIGGPPHVNIPFNPSPQEGKSDSDAFQPVFVASPFLDDLGEDVMKPMVLKEGRDFTTTPPTTPRQPVLEDFF